MSVHYKFKNTKDYDAVKFDGVYISGLELKMNIAAQKKLSLSELQVTNEDTGQIYTDDQNIPKNTNVIAIRIPNPNAQKRARLSVNHNATGNSSGNTSGNIGNNHNNNHHHHNHHHHHHHHKSNNRHNHHNHHSQSSSNPSSSQDHFGGSGLGGGREALELVSTKNMTEEEKIKCIQTQSTKDFEPSRYARGGRGGYRGGRGGSRPFIPGPGYVCKKCNIPGHSIHDCKGHVPKVKRSSGIPRDFLIKADSKDKGALMTPSGEYAVPYIDREAYSNPKIEKAPFFEDGNSDDTTTTTTKETTNNNASSSKSDSNSRTASDSKSISST